LIIAYRPMSSISAKYSEREQDQVSEWLLLNANSAIFQLYYGDSIICKTI